MGQLEFDFGISVLADYDEDGFAQIQVDSPGVGGTEGTQPAEALLPTGFYARPLDPDRGPNGEIGLGAPILHVSVGDRRYAIPLGDPRDVIKGRIPKLKKGGKMIAGGAGDLRSFVMIDGLDPTGTKQPGSVMISASYSKGGAKKSLGLSFNVRDQGKEDISLLHGDGARVTIDSSGTTVTAPNGEHYLQVSDDGNVLAGSAQVQGSLVVGEALAAQPLANGTALVALLGQLIGIVATINATTPGAPAATLAPQLSSLLTKHIKST